MTDHLSHQGHSGYHAPETRPVLRLLALTAVAIGVLVLAAAAFALSYQGIHLVAREAGVSARLARVYPVIIDAMVVIAGAAVLALRGGGLVSRCYAWLSLLVLIAAGAAADVLHATATKLPYKPAAITAAVLPWALVLIGFWLLVAIVRHARLHRTTATTGRPVAGNQRPGSGQPAQYRPAGPPPIPVLAQSPITPSPMPLSQVPAQGPTPAQAPALLSSALSVEPAAPIITEPSSRPEPAQPEPARPESTQPETAQPETAQPEKAEPEVTAPETAAAPDVTQPEAAAGPVVPEPETTREQQTATAISVPAEPPAAAAVPAGPEPVAAEPVAAEPAVSEAAEPGPVEPRAAEPAVAQAAGSGPVQPEIAEFEHESGQEEPASSPVPAFHRVWSSPTPPGEDDQD
jgi:Protein of unknown function (DUF2637)